MSTSRKTNGLLHLMQSKNMSEISQKSGLARTVLYRLLEGGGITMKSAVALSRAFPSLHFTVGRRKYVIREVLKREA